MSDKLAYPSAILVTDRFKEVRDQLLELLEGLSPEDWSRSTAATLWSVKDVALHLLGGDIGNLSRRRDQFRPDTKPIADYRGLVAFINELNGDWVRAARRMSTPLLCDLLDFTGPHLAAYFASLDLFDLGEPVSWAGPDRAPVWFDVAREYTEQWHHQQQIRDATNRPPLYSPRLFAPVLDTFMRATPHTYRETEASEETVVEFEVTGAAGGRWFLQRQRNAWELLVGTPLPPAATLSISQDIAWRVFTKGIHPDHARSLTTIRGNAALAEPFFRATAVLA